MLSFRVEWIDVRANIASATQPVYILKRELAHGDKAKGGVFNTAEVARVGKYWVPQRSLLEENNEWTLCRAGDLVRIPVQAYLTNDLALAAIFGLGVQLGVCAVQQLTQQSSAEVQEAVLVIGHECSNLQPQADQFRCYIGIALRTN